MVEIDVDAGYIDLEQALHVRSLIDKAILEKGEDYIYPRVGVQSDATTCFYLEYEDAIQMVNPVGPACLVGHVLVYDGWEYKQLREHEGTGVPGLDPYSDGVNGALRCAQQAQDGGATWAKAREAYDLFIKSFTDDYNPGRDA